MWQFVIGMLFAFSFTHGNPAMFYPALFFVGWAMVKLYDHLNAPSVKTKSAPRTQCSSENEGFTGRTVYDKTRYFYDDDNNYIDIEDGSFTEGLDGRYRDDAGRVVERDWDGELRLVEDRRYGGR